MTFVFVHFRAYVSPLPLRGRATRYLQHLIGLARAHLGAAVPLYTTDFGNLAAMQRGSLPGAPENGAPTPPAPRPPPLPPRLAGRAPGARRRAAGGRGRGADGRRLRAREQLLRVCTPPPPAPPRADPTRDSELRAR